MAKDTITVAGAEYTPTLLPVDYGGTVVCRLSLHLADGRYLERSTLSSPSLELEEALRETYRLLEEDCTAAYTATGTLPQPAYRKGLQ